MPSELAQELLEVADQYMLETLKRLCEGAITEQLAPDNVRCAAAARGRALESPGLLLRWRPARPPPHRR